VIDRPTLLETASDDQNPGSKGWNVIDRATWERLSRPLELPESSRLELVHAIVLERAKQRARANHRSPAPSQSRKELARLRRLAKELAKGLREAEEGAASALLAALTEEAINRSGFQNLLELYDAKPIEALVADVERIRDRLTRAVEISDPWQGRKGGDSTLRDFVTYLDDFLRRHTGSGLARTSLPTRKPKKAAPGRGTNCLDFVIALTDLAFGEDAIKAATIDDAMKDVIAYRRRGGE
jgi:hypothetical protein